MMHTNLVLPLAALLVCVPVFLNVLLTIIHIGVAMRLHVLLIIARQHTDARY